MNSNQENHHCDAMAINNTNTNTTSVVSNSSSSSSTEGINQNGNEADTRSLSSFAEDTGSNGGSTYGGRDSASTINLVKPKQQGTRGGDAGNHRRRLAHRESSQIRYSKALMLAVLGLAAGLMGYFTFTIFSNKEDDEFNFEFNAYGNEVLDSSVITAQNIFATIESMSVVITSFAQATNATWPFVTIPDYAHRGSNLLELSGSTYLGLLPLVTAENRPKWETYSQENAGWLDDPLPESLLNAGSGSFGVRSRARGLFSFGNDMPAGSPPSADANVTSNGASGGSGDYGGGDYGGGGGDGGGYGGGGDGEDGDKFSGGEWPGSGPGASSKIVPYIYTFGDDGSFIPIPDTSIPDPYYCVFWQVTPPASNIVNFNALAFGGIFENVYDTMLEAGTAVLSPMSIKEANLTDPGTWPFSYLLQPIHETLEAGSPIVALFGAAIPWQNYFERVLPDNVQSLLAVVKNTCDQTVTYRIDGPDVFYMGNEDLHDKKFRHMALSRSFDALNPLEGDSVCTYSVHLYPTQDFEDGYKSRYPLLYTIAVVLIFVVTSAIFTLYDCLVEKRQTLVMHSAVRTGAIVSSLFPAQFRDRVIEDDAAKQKTLNGGSNAWNSAQPQGVDSRMQQANRGENEKTRLLMSRPIADLFPSVTVMFADIAGFTAWSSVREPSQVFTLLEQIYSSFDVVANRRRVFKVETIGDCYVAACGLPEARDDHAVVMIRFARECLHEMVEAVQSLEVLLGPDTAELAMRVGIHSGSVTAGVLRGEKTRFQLFGDTVNTAARMESTGIRNRIHISAETAALLRSCGKGHWVSAREETVHVKGKGDTQTYWASARRSAAASTASAASSGPAGLGKSGRGNHEESSSPARINPNDELQQTVHSVRRSKIMKQLGHERKIQRLIEWNAEVLQGLLQKIIAMRNNPNAPCTDLLIHSGQDRTVLDEVEEIIHLPGKAAKYHHDPATIELHPDVTRQLQDYVSSIAQMYRPNSFHGFEHASHVVQSVTKLLSRVVTPDSIDYQEMAYKQQLGAAKMHEFTYGIASDPLTQFACAFSALIHDVDHTGVPNSILIKEQTDVAAHYNNKSVAEQNSVDLAWELLNQPEFKSLRACIYQTKEELRRFRQLVVNSVMATDIADKGLGTLRKARWEKAFADDSRSSSLDDAASTSTVSQLDNAGNTHGDGETSKRRPRSKRESSRTATNRKATIVIEHLIQASDVSHTMQHWHVYLKWNERLFHEMYASYLAGRSEDDPSLAWYEGELGFFDFYLIPLGKKLATCGVFGVTSDEYLNYALANRAEWEAKGKQIVQGYLSKY